MRRILSSLTVLVIGLSVHAQFYTIENKHVKKTGKPVVQVENAKGNAKVSNTLKEDIQSSEEYFELPEHKDIAIEYDIPLFVSVRDSMMYELLGKRRYVALPLDFLKITSDYGYREDPFTKCSRWHSGVDLRARYAHVYAMFPGVVEKVERKTTGYGNNVIINHGDLRVRYAHLSFIAVTERQVLSAGAINSSASALRDRRTVIHGWRRMEKDRSRAVSYVP